MNEEDTVDEVDKEPFHGESISNFSHLQSKLILLFRRLLQLFSSKDLFKVSYLQNKISAI